MENNGYTKDHRDFFIIIDQHKFSKKKFGISKYLATLIETRNVFNL